MGSVWGGSTLFCSTLLCCCWPVLHSGIEEMEVLHTLLKGWVSSSDPKQLPFRGQSLSQQAHPLSL
eukprot:1938631-Amphidinium_carterae.1